MKNYSLLGILFLLILIAGGYLAFLYGRKTKQFHWSEYAAILLLPFIFILALAYFVKKEILSLFFISSFFGMILEYGVGFVYHKTLSRRLWTYEKFSISGYTSWLSFPLWGIAGVCFWFLIKIMGL